MAITSGSIDTFNLRLEYYGSAAGQIQAEKMASVIGNDFNAGQMFLVRLQAAMTTVAAPVTVEYHFIAAGRCLKAVVRTGLIRMKIEGQQQPGTFENNIQQ